MKASRTARGLDRLQTKRVAIWGPGIEGTAVAKAALSRGSAVTFIDDRALQPGGKIEIRTEGPTASSDSLDAMVEVKGPSSLVEDAYDVLVRTPGVSIYRNELLRAAGRGLPVTSATEMWLEDFSGSRIVAVTGTKGKTTTAWLVSLVLGSCGRRVALAGNMGTPLVALYEQDPSDVYVIELSSFQTADLAVSPPIAVLTLLSADHLDWHGTYDNYVRDKLNLFAHRPDIALAVNSSSPEALNRTSRVARRTLYGAAGRVRVGGGQVSSDGSALFDIRDLPLRGEHNIVNLCGALTACLLAGEELPAPDRLLEAVRKMPVLPSRLQTIATIEGIEYVNDALASNPAGAAAALRTFAGRRIAMIVGGQDRGVPLTPLTAELARACPRPVLVILPDVGTRLEGELEESGIDTICVRAGGVAEAVMRASELAGPDGVVLFAPAAPTPMVEGSYVQRGALFDEAVHDLVRRE